MIIAKHTPSLLQITHDERSELGGAFFTLRDDKGGPIAIVLDPDQDTVPDVAEAEQANADRLRDCWNGCVDITNPARDLETARQSLRNAIAQIPGDTNGMAHVRAALDLLTGKA